MKCSEIENKLVDYLDGNLASEDHQTIEKHIQECPDCVRAVEETKILFGSFKEVPMIAPSDQLRERFAQQLEEEKELYRTSLSHTTMTSTTSTREFPWKTAFQIAASVLLLIGGYAMGSFRESVKTNSQITSLELQTSELKQGMMLAMLENRSVSKRIQAVNYSEDMPAPDTAVLDALIDRLHFDGSVNVRLAAAEALSKYMSNENVKKAFITSLTNEKNPNIQIAVMQFLVTIQDKRALAPMQQLLEHSETPDYVKEQVNAGMKQII